MRSGLILISTFAAAVLINNSCAQRRNPSSSPWQNNYKLDRPAGAIVSALRAGQEQRLLVVLKHDAEVMGLNDDMIDSDSDDAIAVRAAKYNELKQSIISTAQSKNVKSEDVYSHLPIIKISVSSLKDLLAIANDQNVQSISEDVQFKYKATANLNLIKHSEAMQTGFNGAGTAVAVLDTGLDYKRAAFGPCTAPATPADKCRVIHVQDFARNDNTLDDSSLHGTNVAGIVAMVAPGTKLIGLDVFDGEGAYTSDIVNAINWVIANKSKYNIAAMNMSLGSSGFNNCTTGSMAAAIASARNAGILSAVASGNSGSTTLDYPACSPYALSVGAVYDSNIGTVDWGCSTKDVSAADKITCFSCTSSDLKIAAPGVKIVAAGITMTGTSQATPHVAGSIAVLKSAFPNENINQIQERLTSTGKRVPLPKFPNTSIPRLDLAAALGPQCQFVLPTEIKTLDATVEVSFTTGSNCKWNIVSDTNWIGVTTASSGQGSGKFALSLQKPLATERSGTVSMTGDGSKVSLKVIQPPDTEAPNGSLVINGNMGTQYTTLRDVQLLLDVKDINGIDTMCISNSSTCSEFIPFDSMPKWQLSEGDGVKTVYVLLRDKIGNTTNTNQPLTKSIILDTTPPSDGTLSTKLSSIAQHVDLTWSGFTDVISPVQKYVVVYSTTQTPTSCSDGSVIYSDFGTSKSHGPLAPGTYYYRVCAENSAKLQSTGATASFTVVELDKLPPTGTVRINNNAPFTRSSSVTVAIQATDASGVAKMCLSTSSTCRTWENFAPTKTIRLTWGQGLRTIYAWFEDKLGNRNATPVKDDIIVDSSAPITRLMSIQPMQNSAKITWTAASDPNGIAGYKLVYKVGFSAPKIYCTDGTNVPVTPGFLEATATNLAASTTHAFRLCAIDRAGNVSVGSFTTARIK
jgi:subtilisin family serine protease